ncbi:hypothetical protein HanPI659440_Chr03g0096761 [Helianthus annuus]|nr:hypothetical protein HanPI659440_Chr03g0096761 [Helianthus annuus]
MVAMVQVVVACVAWVLTTLSILATTSENERHKHIPLGFRQDFCYRCIEDLSRPNLKRESGCRDI